MLAGQSPAGRIETITQPVRNVIGFDDGPPVAGGRVPLVGAVFCGERLDGVVTTTLEADGVDGTDALVGALLGSRFIEHVGAVLLQGVTFGGFNVVDAAAIVRRTDRPVLIVCRRRPDLAGIRDALETHFADGATRWQRIRVLPPPVAVGPIHAQWLGMDEDRARATITWHARHGHLPEPLRVAHLIAGALGDGHSRGRA